MNATTPRRADVSAHNTPSKSPSRRVLGDLTPKPINTPSKQTNNLDRSETTKAHSPLKQVQALSPQFFKEKENILATSTLQAGRKRGINEVDDAENVDSAGKAFAERDVGSLRVGEPVTVETMDTLPGYHQSADRGSSTEPDTPPPEPMEEVINNSQASSQSFSNFVDWKECDSQSADQPPAPVAAPIAESERKSTRADLLRLRLGFANYKVKTNQVGKSGSDIMSTWESFSSNSLNASTSSAATITTSATSNQAVPSIILSPARRESISHVTANLDPGRPIPKLAGGPVLLPTAYSSRMIHDYHMPSSPPDSLPKCVSPEQVMSPTRPDYRTPTARRIRDEDEDDEDGDEVTPEESVQRQREKRFDLGDLTSSVVKNNVAKGLLELSGRR